MAEGFAKIYLSDKFAVFSAGIEAHGLNPYAIKVMDEAGIDISLQKSQKVSDLSVQDFDYVITVCGHADENCPVFSAKTRVIHKGFEDPPKLAKDAKTEEEKLYFYRKVRDEIKEYILKLEDKIKTN